MIIGRRFADDLESVCAMSTAELCLGQSGIAEEFEPLSDPAPDDLVSVADSVQQRKTFGETPSRC
jgi:hypothetical protein